MLSRIKKISKTFILYISQFEKKINVKFYFEKCVMEISTKSVQIALNWKTKAFQIFLLASIRWEVAPS